MFSGLKRNKNKYERSYIDAQDWFLIERNWDWEFKRESENAWEKEKKLKDNEGDRKERKERNRMK